MTAKIKPNVWSRILDLVFGEKASPKEQEQPIECRPPRLVSGLLAASSFISLSFLAFVFARRLEWISYPSEFLDDWGLMVGFVLIIAWNLAVRAIDVHYERAYYRKRRRTTQ